MIAGIPRNMRVDASLELRVEPGEATSTIFSLAMAYTFYWASFPYKTRSVKDPSCSIGIHPDRCDTLSQYLPAPSARVSPLGRRP
jgi:hypothetical protein